MRSSCSSSPGTVFESVSARGGAEINWFAICACCLDFLISSGVTWSQTDPDSPISTTQYGLTIFCVFLAAPETFWFRSVAFLWVLPICQKMQVDQQTDIAGSYCSANRKVWQKIVNRTTANVFPTCLYFMWAVGGAQETHLLLAGARCGKKQIQLQSMYLHIACCVYIQDYICTFVNIYNILICIYICCLWSQNELVPSGEHADIYKHACLYYTRICHESVL